MLDIVCGTGPHLLRLAERGYRMLGLDLSARTSPSSTTGWPPGDLPPS
jgi:2-polyprenyl-3-methyl-5-hydroxy-6-metoxy-1,4-benzoquinol methylase